MGARRIDPRQRSVLLSVEPLEDRFLLSAAAISGVGGYAVPAPPNPVADQQRVQPQPSSSNDSAAQQTTARASVPLLATKMVQDEPRYALSGGSSGPSSGVHAASGSIAGIPLPTSNSVTGEKGNWPALYPVFSSHATIADAWGPDHDDDSPTMEHEEAHLHSHPASFEQYLPTNSAIARTHDDASAGTGGTPIPAGSLHAALNLLSAAGLGTVGVARVATVLPAAASLVTGGGQGHSEGNEGRETTPKAPNSLPLVIPPPAEEEEGPPPASAPCGPFADLLPIDMEAIQRSADAFFEQLTHLSDEWQDSRAIEKLTPWLIAASVVAYKWAWLRRKGSFSTPDSEDNWEAGPAVFLTGDEG